MDVITPHPLRPNHCLAAFIGSNPFSLLACSSKVQRERGQLLDFQPSRWALSAPTSQHGFGPRCPSAPAGRKGPGFLQTSEKAPDATARAAPGRGRYKQPISKEAEGRPGNVNGGADEATPQLPSLGGLGMACHSVLERCNSSTEGTPGCKRTSRQWG